MPDGVLVPRMSEDQLDAKNTAYANDGVDPTKNQNGALVFVTAVDGTTTGKTVNVTAVGFYYYDGPSCTQKVVGGGGSATDTSIYLADGTLSTVRTVNQDNKNSTFTTGTARFIVNGTQQNTGAQYVKFRKASTSPLTWNSDDYAIALEFGSNFSGGGLSLPDATTNVGRMVYIGNSSGNTATFTTLNTTTSPRAGSTITTGTGFTYVSDGATWYVISGR